MTHAVICSVAVALPMFVTAQLLMSAFSVIVPVGSGMDGRAHAFVLLADHRAAVDAAGLQWNVGACAPDTLMAELRFNSSAVGAFAEAVWPCSVPAPLAAWCIAVASAALVLFAFATGFVYLCA